MSDLRYDPVSGHWVTIARNRLDRPSEFMPLEQIRQQLICPFCRGNEDQTPSEVVAYRDDGTPLADDDDPSSWTVRVVPNKFPSFTLSSSNTNHKGPYGGASVGGRQLLIIPSSRHLTSVSELNEEELHVMLMACQVEIAKLRDDSSIEHAMLFMNCRSAAGASLGHIHLQLIGSPIISESLQARTRRNEQSVHEQGCSLLKRILNWEIQEKVRIIKLTDNFCVFCPYASRFPFQIWIVPLEPQGGFVACPAAKRNELAQHCRSMVEQLEQRLDHPAYNLLVHSSPFEMAEHDHWFVELFPRLTCVAGYEWGTDIWVNPVAPEAAARRLQSSV